jgi:hypothetical protein
MTAGVECPRLCVALHSRDYGEFGTMRTWRGGEARGRFSLRGLAG